MVDWVRAYQFVNSHKDAPRDLFRFAECRFKKAIDKKQRPKIKVPRGFDKRTKREILEGQLDDLCRELYKARDLKGGQWGNCISCGNPKLASELQWGHFIAQVQSQYLRWDPRNFAAQCTHCNIWRQGNQVEYGAALDRMHGDGFSEGLRIEANVNKLWKPSLVWMEEKKEWLRAEINGIKGA